MTTIAFIGIGHMGLPMAINLIKAGHTVTVFDLMPESLAQAEKAGAAVAESALRAATGAAVVLTMLQTGEQVKKTCLGDAGVFSVMDEGTLFCDCSTIDIATSRDIHAVAENSRILMVDSPVSGGVPGATAATLTFMVGGSEAAFNASNPILSHMGKAIIHAGEPGTGLVAKTCNNMILGISMIAVSEGFALGEKLGLSPEKLFEISSQSSGQCWSMTSYCPVPGLVDAAPSNNDFKPGFSSAMMLKDLNLSQDAATSVDCHTTLGHAARQLYQAFVDADNADVDFSGIIKTL